MHAVPAKSAIGVLPEQAVHAASVPVITEPAAQAETQLDAPALLNACPLGQVLRQVIPSTAVKVGVPDKVLQLTQAPGVEGFERPVEKR